MAPTTVPDCVHLLIVRRIRTRNDEQRLPGSAVWRNNQTLPRMNCQIENMGTDGIRASGTDKNDCEHCRQDQSMSPTHPDRPFSLPASISLETLPRDRPKFNARVNPLRVITQEAAQRTGGRAAQLSGATPLTQ